MASACLRLRHANASLGQPCVRLARLTAPPCAVADSSRADDAKPVWTQLYVDGLCCPAEAPLVHRILTPLAGVHEVGLPIHSS